MQARVTKVFPIFLNCLVPEKMNIILYQLSYLLFPLNLSASAIKIFMCLLYYSNSIKFILLVLHIFFPTKQTIHEKITVVLGIFSHL